MFYEFDTIKHIKNFEKYGNIAKYNNNIENIFHFNCSYPFRPIVL